MWEPRPLATLGASTACNRAIFTFLYVYNRQAPTWNVFVLSNIGNMSSNPTRVMDVSAFILCLCCPVLVAALRLAHPPSKKSYRLSMRLRNCPMLQREQKELNTYRIYSCIRFVDISLKWFVSGFVVLTYPLFSCIIFKSCISWRIMSRLIIHTILHE
jgi:hypothetical protein